MKDFEKRLVIALVLSVIILTGYSYFITKYFPQYKPQQRSIFSSREQTHPDIPKPYFNEQVTTAVMQDKTKEQAMFEKAAEIKEQIIVFENENYVIVCTNIGGAIKEINLKKYPDPATNTATQLFSIGKQSGVFSLYNFCKDNELANAPYKINKFSDRMEMEYMYKDQFKITKRIIPDKEAHLIHFEIDFKNLTNQNQNISYKLITGTGMQRETGISARYYDVDTLLQDKKRFLIRGVKDENLLTRQGKIKWSALKNRYFSLIVSPQIDTTGIFVIGTNNELTFGIELDNFNIIPYASATHKYALYAGPNDYNMLKNIGLESVIAHGALSGISKILMTLLVFFHSLFKNWGVAIIVLSVMINLFLFPITSKSMRSMKDMQMLQPKVEALRQQYKDNPQKMNREVMEIYKKHKVNPVGGCLPLFLQLPVFFALYQVLLRTVALRGAHFLWIKDLSGPDAAFKLSPQLPFLGDSINILPIIMAALTFIQQKTSTQNTAGTEEQRQQQKMMSMMMPILFGVLFYNFPSGLVLYWLTNTLFTTFIQKKLMTMPKVS
ncbi:MAG: membrane protein insertase YidC [Candidatus Omnitrophota bacterium]